MRSLLISRWNSDQYYIDALEEMDRDVVIVSIQLGNEISLLKSKKFPIYQYPYRARLLQDPAPYYAGLADYIKNLNLGPFHLIPSFGFETYNLFMDQCEEWANIKNETTDKLKFHQRLVKSKVNLPKLYDIVDEAELPQESKIEKYPCIVKPSAGSTGGIGVEVIHNKEQLNLFFNKSVRRISKDQIPPHLCYGQKFINYFNYWSQGQPYMIEELIKGRSIAAGLVIDKDLDIHIEILFDVIHSPHEKYRGETGYIYPSEGGAKDIELVYQLMTHLKEAGELRPGHYMIDAIIQGHEIYLIEGTPRPSLDACQLLRYGAKRATFYIKKGLLAAEGKSIDDYEISSMNMKHTYYRYFNYPPGKITKISYPEKKDWPGSLVAFYSPLEKNSVIRQHRMTDNMNKQGFAVFVDPLREKVKADSQRLIDSIKIEYDTTQHKERKLIAATCNCLPIVEYLAQSGIPFDVLFIESDHPANEKTFNKFKTFTSRVYWHKTHHLEFSDVSQFENKIDEIVASLPWEDYNSVVPSTASEGVLGLKLAKYASQNACFFYPVDFAKIAFDKNKYLKKLSEANLNIKSPKNRAALSDEDFPVICKPIYGSGGRGVYVAKNKEKLEGFLGTQNQKSRHYHYIPSLGDYRVESFIKGPVISVSGYVEKGKCYIDLAFELLMTGMPFRAEYACRSPLPFGIEQKKVQELSEQVISALNMEHGPFMLDFIVDAEGVFWVIDFSPRFSSTGIPMVHWVSQGKKDHVHNGLESYWGERDVKIEPHDQDRPVLYGGLLLPKGIVKKFNHNVFYRPDIIDWDCHLSKGHWSLESRLDYNIFSNGWVALTREDTHKMTETYLQLIQDLNVEFSQTLPPGEIWI